jgi:hypothetical protein
MATPSYRTMIAGACCLAAVVLAVALGGCSTAAPTLSSDEPGYYYRPAAVDGSGNLHNGAVYQRYLALRQLDQAGGGDAGPAVSAASGRRGGGSDNGDFMTFAAPPPFGAGNGQLLYDPQVSVVATGSVLDVQGTVSADRRYVTVTARPQVTGNLEMFQYAITRP